MKKLTAAFATAVLALGLASAVWSAAPTPPPAKKPAARQPATGPTKPGKSKAEKLGSKKININTARAKTLQRLPGVGDARAKKIIEERKKKPFTSLDELVSRKILSQKDLDKIKDNLSVSDK
jgi:competence protein ComEA